MALLGIETLIYGVDDLDASLKFYDDFGLQSVERDAGGAVYRLPEGSSFVVRHSDDPRLPPKFLNGPGPREIIWGVDSSATLVAISAELGHDREVRQDTDGTLHTKDDSGIAIGFRVFDRQPLPVDPAPPENNLSEPVRWNRHRKWYERAAPKLINHVVFGVPDVDVAVAFYVDRLGFRITDIMRGFGMFMRCDGRHDHHNLFVFRGNGRLFFSHVSFGVETIDELMVGAMQMQRQGWTSDFGLGRHRISSLVFYYMNSPAGGQTEYSADSDYLDDDWTPRLWDQEFGQHHWLAALPESARIAATGVAEPLGGVRPNLDATIRPRGP
jgi:catechol 2,3-dioxygenase-like lactoylglutathione lyase family enzyme